MPLTAADGPGCGVCELERRPPPTVPGRRPRRTARVPKLVPLLRHLTPRPHRAAGKPQPMPLTAADGPGCGVCELERRPPPTVPGRRPRRTARGT
ncbi:hypothetical protein ACPCSQ_10935, partial [Streptomyces griseoincarnatus]